MDLNNLDKQIGKEYIKTQNFKRDLRTIENILFELQFTDKKELKELLKNERIYFIRKFKELCKTYKYEPIYNFNENTIKQHYKDLYRIIINSYINCLYDLRYLIEKNL